MRDQIAEYIKDITISTHKELFDVLNFIAPLIDEWSLAEPKSGRQIMRFVPAKARKNAYVEFTIPKKSGGQRKISAPVKPLKAMQSAITILLQSIFVPDDHATGFVLGTEISRIITNVINGKINYLEMIKGNEDSTYRKFKSRFNHLQWKEKQSTDQIQMAI